MQEWSVRWILASGKQILVMVQAMSHAHALALAATKITEDECDQVRNVHYWYS